ncbi:Wzz/FepE/Etk N-terminal domain-containing protein [Porticoccaceae bacterium]|nr:Wzz/FepE/Etk N-terminal domain-containing protein [Porticoccaceae bacterium]MDB2382784.1 Wzz/FepE/Etk N-terminal domain-containing protein [Porticoccaceae bacterium]MDB2566038.1 Wzz/FepE/Etk N-terminal domain-containing protein [Porticoccaceae bacterium]
MENNSQTNDQYDDEIDLRELFGVLWGNKIKIIGITAVFAVVSLIYALSVPNQYKASALLAPAQQQSGGLSGALGQLGGLASLAGVSIGGGESSEAQVAQEIMKSWSFIEGFIADNDLAVEVYAAEGWSRESNQLKFDNDVYAVKTKTWLVENDNIGRLGPPTSWQLFEKFSEMLAVSEDKKSGLISISIEYYSPQIAKQWLDLYILSINKHMQARQVVKVSNNIEYLEAQIEKTSITEMQEVFYTIIEEQIKSQMLAEASPEYAFVAVSPSMVPEEKSQPKRALICILGTLLGGILSVLTVLVLHFARKPD